MRRTGAAPEWRDANVDAAPAKVPRRVVPTPVPLNSTGTVQSEAPSSAPPARSPSPADPMDTEQRSVDEEEGSESEHLDLDDREARDKMLMNLSDEEKQALVDQMLEAMGAVDHYAEMLEGGPPDRPLGKKCDAVCDARIQVRARGTTRPRSSPSACPVESMLLRRWRRRVSKILSPRCERRDFRCLDPSLSRRATALPRTTLPPPLDQPASAVLLRPPIYSATPPTHSSHPSPGPPDGLAADSVAAV